MWACTPLREEGDPHGISTAVAGQLKCSKKALTSMLVEFNLEENEVGFFACLI